MSAKQSSGEGGFQSAAGLMRYFDEEEGKSPKIDPRIVIATAVILMVTIEIAKWQFPT